MIEEPLTCRERYNLVMRCSSEDKRKGIHLLLRYVANQQVEYSGESFGMPKVTMPLLYIEVLFSRDIILPRPESAV